MDYKKVIMHWKEFEIPKVLPRNKSINLDHDLISAVTGPRRAGKTYLCFQKIKKLLDEGISRENILYINFEDDRLLGAKIEDARKLLDAFYELSEINNDQKIYLFLDEIQNVDDWDAWVRRLHDAEKDLKIVITGSSSKFLSKEISTKLRGRVYEIEVYPLSFEEYLEWKNIEFNLKTVSYSKKRSGILKEFREYLKQGGYPALFMNPSLPQDELLQNYFDSMILKDVAERHNIDSIKKLELLAKFLFESTTKQISYTKLTNKFNSLGFDISKNTVIEYISHLEDAYLFFQNLKYEYSLTKQLGAIKKVYCIDNGLLNAVSFKFSEDYGKLLENLVFIRLKSLSNDVYYWKGNYECDFVVKEKNEVKDAIQVCYNLNKSNRERELNGVMEAMDKFNLDRGLILTYDQKDELEKDKKTIEVKPTWKWLLEKEKA